MDKRLLKVRKKLYNDFPFYSKASLKIRTKLGEITNLKLNPAQKILQKAVDKQLKAEKKIRIIILKARQQGLSTYVGGYLYFNVSQNRARKAKDEIIALNVAHCNANGVTIATGENAQVTQAFELKVVKTAKEVNEEAEANAPK